MNKNGRWIKTIYGREWRTDADDMQDGALALLIVLFLLGLHFAKII
jgi:hypothetical protein